MILYKGFFDYGSDVMSIVAFAELAFSSTVSALSVAGVAIDIGSRLTALVDFYAEREYTVSLFLILHMIFLYHILLF